ncbi:histidyl-tRNA synthetase [Methylocella silvestris BL2]|uniref:Histidine--tRNA ligase n=1 Tax=Methylocella silvestris (strain DSM 15510 / CIP 108128 / LMG 27833 / NCIMB 13906 / BL2) TaxID=395965 RepID=SYH_METSB|nr:histidine--tRNA ligase [Methylocella silvestris]B8ER30.1 RecName: Full=Histidine--tRNA ligase; AltName: Full=Histidyl-tRNA synthetase; Short=HisRS [Methylocella silvestris BL2]ACK49775.1 histidyl-tRNA synthetase [Methylocella silvestris BL2]
MTDDKTTPARASAKLPRGFGDRGPAEIAATEKMLAAIRASYELYGFEAVETPFIEFTDALGKFLPDLDRPNEGVFSFKDDDESWLSLRYDLTAPLARFVAENFDKLPKPYRSYRAGYVFRNEKPGPGRFRQFMQFDADTVGAPSVAADAEMCMMAADTLERLGVKRGDYVIKVNNRKVLDGVLEAIGLGGEENAGRRMTVLRAIDKLDKFGPEGVALLLGPGRKDESGDFTKGAGLERTAVERVLNYVAAQGEGTAQMLGVLRASVAGSQRGEEGVAELAEIAALIDAAGFSARIRIDPSVVRGLEYYTGPVFEAELTFEVQGEDGKPVRFGSIGGGGRYDGLVGRFRGENVPATGFSIGVSRLYSALKAVGSPIVSAASQPGPVVVLVLDREHLARYQGFVTALRSADIRAELYLGGSGMNAQLKYADKRGSLCAVIQGSNERDHAEGARVTIRDLALGAELAGASKDRADYLELRAKAQFTVAEQNLVDAVREVMARRS